MLQPPPPLPASSAEPRIHTENTGQRVTRVILRVVGALAIGFAADLGRRMFEPASGPLGIFFLPFWAALNSLGAVALALVAGLVFRVPAVGRGWNRGAKPAALLAALGLASFGAGVFIARHTYWVDHGSAEEADRWLEVVAQPGYILLIFCIVNWPHRTAAGAVAANGASETTQAP